MKTFEQEFEITDTEKELIIQHLAEMYRDNVNVNSVNMARKATAILWGQFIQKRDLLNLTFNTKVEIEDILLILGRKDASTT